MAFQLTPTPKFQAFDDNGNPLTGGKVYSYLAGSTTPVDTYTDSSGQTANTNPVILDARGEADLWLSQNLVYKLVLTDENDVEIWSVDNISAAGGSGGGDTGTDEYVKVSGTDVASQYLSEKLEAGAGIQIDVLDPGGVEKLQISATSLGTPNLQEVTEEGATTTENLTIGTSLLLSDQATNNLFITSLGSLGGVSGFNISHTSGGDFAVANFLDGNGSTITSPGSVLTLGASFQNIYKMFLNGTDVGTSTAGMKMLVQDPNNSNEIKLADIAEGTASFYTQTFVEADLVGRVLTITHNLDSEDILLTLFDADKKVYIPDEYQVIDANNVEVTINASVVGINKIVSCADAQSARGSNDVQNRVIVTQANVGTTLGGTIDSTKEYFIDGQIDTGTTQITVPATGMTLTGYNFDLSALYSSENNYTMFISDVGGSGNILGRDYEIRVTGTGSKVYDITDANGFNAFEFARVNYSDCTSLGEITNYRQGLENGTGRFGGSPSLTLSGTWLGGYRIVTSIVRSMSNTTTEPLFKAGAGFTMASRFATDMNVDLGDLQPLLDFSPSNFVNPSTLQLQETILTRGGNLDPTDSNITPNIEPSDLESYWKRNVGVSNTYVGGTITVVSESLTTISAVDTWTDIEGVFLGTGLQHFSSNSDGELTHDGVSPREFEFTGSFIIESSANRSLSIRFNKWDNSTSTFTPLNYTIQTRTVNSLVGGRDVALFVVDVGGELDQGDYLKIQVRNNTDSNNVTLENSSFYRVQER